MTAVTTTTAAAGAEILAVLDEHAAAHAARDVQRMLAPYTADATCYTLAPPLQQGPGTPYGTPGGLQKWLASFEGPVLIDYHNPVVTIFRTSVVQVLVRQELGGDLRDDRIVVARDQQRGRVASSTGSAGRCAWLAGWLAGCGGLPAEADLLLRP